VAIESTALAADQPTGLLLGDGFVSPKEGQGRFTSAVKRFEEKRKAVSVTFEQSPVWHNWLQALTFRLARPTTFCSGSAI